MAATELDRETDAFFKSGGKAMDEPPPVADTPEATPEPEAKPDRARDEGGRFAKAEDKPEPKAEAKDAKAEGKPDAKTPPEGYVPHGALHEERERRKKMQAELDDIKRRNEAMEARFGQLMERFKPQAPDLQQDPVGHLSHRLNELGQEVQQQRDYRQRNEAQIAQQQQWQQFLNAYGAASQQFTQSQPDYVKAHSALMTAMIADYQALGYDQAQATQMANQQEVQIAAKAFQDGVNPAERVYRLAQRRGYKLEAAPVDPAAKLAVIEQGQRKSPEFSPGGAGRPKLTLEAVAAMSDEDFGKLDWEKTMRELAA